VEQLNKVPEKSLSEKWADLPTAAKTGVYCGAAAAGVLIIAGGAFYMIQQRKKGRLEYALDDAKWNNERTEINNLQTTWKASEWGNKGYRPVN
jgi:hypothetical protein